MTIEDQVNRTISAIDVAPGDLGVVLVRSRRRRRRIHALGAVVCAAALVIAFGLASGGPLRGGADPARRPAPGGTWHRAADLPIAPRWNPVLAWTGSEVLVIGGATYVPPGSSLDRGEKARLDAEALQSAAFDPATGAWRRIADAPQRFSDDDPLATMAGDSLVMLGYSGDWFRYDVDVDTWTALPAPPEHTRGPVVSVGDEVYTDTFSGQVLGLSPATGTWTTLPHLPLEATVLVGGDTLIAVGRTSDRSDPAGSAAYALAGGRWRPLGAQVANFLSIERAFQVSDPVGGRVETLGATTSESGELALGLTELDVRTGVTTRVALPEDLDADGRATDVGYPIAVDAHHLTAFGVVHDLDADTWSDLRPPWDPSLVGQGVVWAGDRLVVVGGLDGDASIADTWTWTPPTVGLSAPPAPPGGSPRAQALLVSPSTPLHPGDTAVLTPAPGVFRGPDWLMGRDPAPYLPGRATYRLVPGYDGRAPTWEDPKPPVPDFHGGPSSQAPATIAIPTTAEPGTWWICSDPSPNVCASVTVAR